MHLATHGSFSGGSGQVLQRESTDRLSENDNPQILIPILITLLIISISVCFLVVHLISRSWQRKKANVPKTEGAKAIEETNGRSRNAEISSGALVIISEMENIQRTQELPETKDGLSHELPGSTYMPQELPAALHKMSDEGYDKRNETISQNGSVSIKNGGKDGERIVFGETNRRHE
ncbi:hypothetical protein F4860DRAFT_181020 [Xylaria cubensis]|nr:hypothetical protein F4860DRAFT_181020 [Xylaria cubensis]